MERRDAVSARLVSWKRPANVDVIVRHLTELPFIDEILVWNNNPEVDLCLSDPKTRVIRSAENLGCYARFLCAAQARNEVIYTQDDDALIGNIPPLYQAFLDDPSRITHGLSDWHWARRDEYVHGECHLALLGWGAFFDKAWLAELDQLPASVRQSGLFRREADKYFTLLLNRHHNTLRSQLHQLAGHSDPAMALWKQPHHQELSQLATREALRLARQRHRPHLPPRWHVVIPCYNYGRYLEESVRSAVSNEADSVVTVVDDGSCDNSADIARELANRFSGIEVLALPRNLGAAAALNRGIGASDSTYVVRLDADDRMSPTYLRAADTVLSAGADVANPDAILFGEEVSRWPVPDKVTLAALLVRNPVHCISAFRRTYWAQVGGFDEAFRIWEDYDFWIRLAVGGARIHKLPATTSTIDATPTP